MSYHISKTINGSFEDAITKVKTALQEEGFGVISEIDLKEKFREKLNVDFRNYKILGACNPALAYKAIEQEDKIGVMLPCNVLLQENKNGVEVSAINPMETMSAVNNTALSDIANEVSQKLKKAMERL
ncbi:MAG: DUF302 domain-containing protein [Bacteroidia bacterium]